MKNFIPFFLGALVSIVYAQGQLEVEAPFVPLSCLRSFISFSGGQSPYTLSVLAEDTRNVLDSFTVTNSPYLWSIPNAAGRQLRFSIKDATGATAESDAFIVQNDPNFTCSTRFPGEASSSLSSNVAANTASSDVSNTAPGTASSTTSNNAAPNTAAPLSVSQPGGAQSTTTRVGAQSSTSSSQSHNSSAVPLAIFIVIPIVFFLIVIGVIITAIIMLRKCRGNRFGISFSAGVGGHRSQPTNAKLNEIDPYPQPIQKDSYGNGGFVGGFSHTVDNSPDPSVYFPPSTYPPSTYNNPLPYNPVATSRDDHGSLLVPTYPASSVHNTPLSYSPATVSGDDHGDPSVPNYPIPSTQDNPPMFAAPVDEHQTAVVPTNAIPSTDIKASYRNPVANYSEDGSLRAPTYPASSSYHQPPPSYRGPGSTY
ncbi:hypothetical protein FRC20_003615 [Serendipita sp. 405]|nr:hypothetical protein FRC15_002683 [Serendipita sp. 397]KAG8868333.1 hypothetical protein FRC20_003615 [Serendipita sp. 405]